MAKKRFLSNTFCQHFDTFVYILTHFVNIELVLSLNVPKPFLKADLKFPLKNYSNPMIGAWAIWYFWSPDSGSGQHWIIYQYVKEVHIFGQLSVNQEINSEQWIYTHSYYGTINRITNLYTNGQSTFNNTCQDFPRLLTLERIPV